MAKARFARFKNGVAELQLRKGGVAQKLDTLQGGHASRLGTLQGGVAEPTGTLMGGRVNYLTDTQDFIR